MHLPRIEVSEFLLLNRPRVGLHVFLMEYIVIPIDGKVNILSETIPGRDLRPLSFRGRNHLTYTCPGIVDDCVNTVLLDRSLFICMMEKYYFFLQHPPLECSWIPNTPFHQKLKNCYSRYAGNQTCHL